MLSPEQIERLTKLGSEQLAIAEKWDKERDVQNELINQLMEAQENKDMKLWVETMDKMAEVTSDMCEHDRSIWSNCVACDEIEMALHPELFCAECGVPWEVISSEEAEKEHKADDICPDCLFGKE